MQRQIKVRAVILHGEKLFCVRHKDYKTGTPKNFWSLPGGKIDPGENLVAALHREMIEETNVAPEIGNLLFIQQFTSQKQETLEFFFHVANAGDYTNVNLASTTHGEAEIEEIKFINPREEIILPEFLSTEPLNDAIKYSLPTKIISTEKSNLD